MPWDMVSVSPTRGGLFKSVALRTGEREWMGDGNLMSKREGKEPRVSLGKGREVRVRKVSEGGERRREREESAGEAKERDALEAQA